MYYVISASINSSNTLSKLEFYYKSNHRLKIHQRINVLTIKLDMLAGRKAK